MTTESMITIYGTATHEMQNDVLSLFFRVTKENIDANAVKIALSEAVTAALKIVRPYLKPGEVDVETDLFQVSPRYGKANSTKIDGYNGNATITVKGTDTATISKLASEITTMVISGSNNSVSRKAREGVEADLTNIAIQNFRAKADAAAAGFGAKDWTVGDITINISNDQPRYGKVFALSASGGGESAMQVESGKSELTVQVNGSIILGKARRVIK